MIHSETSQQNAFQNPQQQTSPQVAAALQQLAQALQQNQQTQQGGFGQGLGQGAYGQGVFGQNTPFGTGQNWGGQRQWTQQEVSNVLQQIAPILPQIIAQAQQTQMQQPMAAFGGGYGFNQRSLSQQDVNEVVRQILPILPQLLQHQQGYGQGGLGQQGSGWQGQAAYGLTPQQNFGPFGQHQHSNQRQLSPQDVNEIARQLAEVLPYGQRM